MLNIVINTHPIVFMHILASAVWPIETGQRAVSESCQVSWGTEERGVWFASGSAARSAGSPDRETTHPLSPGKQQEEYRNINHLSKAPVRVCTCVSQCCDCAHMLTCRKYVWLVKLLYMYI